MVRPIERVSIVTAGGATRGGGKAGRLVPATRTSTLFVAVARNSRNCKQQTREACASQAMRVLVIAASWHSRDVWCRGVTQFAGAHSNVKPAVPAESSRLSSHARLRRRTILGLLTFMTNCPHPSCSARSFNLL